MSSFYQFRGRDLIKAGRVKQENVDEMRSWCALQDLPPIGEEQVIIFLIACGEDLQLAKNTVKAFYKLQIQSPELFLYRDMDGEDLREAVKTLEIAVMPSRTSTNDGVIFARLKDTSFHKFSLERTVKLGAMIGELPLFGDPPPDGMVTVIDLHGVGVLHLTKIRVGTVQKAMKYVQEAYPCKLKEIHIINTVPFIDRILFIVKPFMKKELFELIDFHPRNMDMEEFFERHLPRECVPEDYGGILPKQEVLSAETYNALRELTPFYKEQEEQMRTLNFLN